MCGTRRHIRARTAHSPDTGARVMVVDTMATVRLDLGGEMESPALESGA